MAAEWIAFALARSTRRSNDRVPDGTDRSAFLDLADVQARGTLWLQSDYPQNIHRRSSQGLPACTAIRRARDTRCIGPYGIRRPPVVAVGVVRMACSNAADDLGMAGFHRS